MYKRIIRRDGSTIVLVPRRESKSATIEIMFKVGSRQERKDINGASHFIEHLMFKGTRRRPTTKVLSRELDSVGAEYNAFTSKDHTAYYIQADMSHLPLAVDMLSDMLHHSKFEPREVERERGVIVEELNMYRDNPVMRIDEIFEGTIFSGSSLGWEIGGPREIIKTVPRAALVNFMRRYYFRGNMVIGISGNFHERDALKLVERHFPVQHKKAKATIHPLTLKQTAPRVTLEFKETDQAQLMLGFPGFKRTHKDAHALLLFAVIMGGNMSSRLFISIRERKGLAYVVRATSEAYEDVGYFAVQAGTDKNKVYKALAAIKEELVRVAAKGITREELRRAKDNIRGRLILKFEQPSSYLSYLLSQQLLVNRIDSLEQKLKKIERVPMDDVNRIARKVIRWSNANLALIGPYKDKEKFMAILR